MGVNESEMREVLWPTSPAGCIPSPWQLLLYCPAASASQTQKQNQNFFFCRTKEHWMFSWSPSLFLSLFLLSSFSLLPSLYFLYTQECFVGSWDKRNKRHHWQKRLCAHPCVWTCVIMWEWDCNYMHFFFLLHVAVVHVCRFSQKGHRVHAFAFYFVQPGLRLKLCGVHNVPWYLQCDVRAQLRWQHVLWSDEKVVCACVSERQNERERWVKGRTREHKRGREKEKDLWQKASLVFWSEE